MCKKYYYSGCDKWSDLNFNDVQGCKTKCEGEMTFNTINLYIIYWNKLLYLLYYTEYSSQNKL